MGRRTAGSAKGYIAESMKNITHVVLWGASYLGDAIGKYLQREGILYDFYWDARYDELKMVNGHEVIEPFTGIDDKDNTLVVLCIGNTAIRSVLLRKLKDNGFYHVLTGDKLYEDEICAFTPDTGIDGEVCNGTMICRSMFCERLHEIVRKQNDKGGVFIPNLTFMITTHCSLGCKYCVSYINSYNESHRRHIPVERVEKDIEAILSTVDSVGSITVQGGEPFLHPELDLIVQKILSYKNIGIVSLATNGIFKIKEEKLRYFKDNRLNVAFSGYYEALPKEKLDIYYHNIKLMEKHHVPHTVGVKVPEWRIPSTLWNRHFSEDVKMKKKQMCKIPMRCMQVMDGKLYPCLFSVSLHGIGLVDYPNDYVALDSENLSELIERFMNQAYYDSCGHCEPSQGSTNMAGEQGYYDFITPGGEN